jgi:predicted secreted hydrolase
VRLPRAAERRRRAGVVLAWVVSFAYAPAGPAADGHYLSYPDVVAGSPMVFPTDHGSHPDYRTEWWYVTGWLQTTAGEQLGFQVTFFRTRPDVPPDNPSAFAPRQLIIAHAALSDPQLGRLRHDQRIARAGFGLADAATGDTDVRLDDWSLSREPGASASYRARVAGDGFAFDLELAATQPAMVNGVDGYSQKGRLPGSASFYYSVPQLTVSGRVERDGQRADVQGSAWLDHEWSTALLDPDAAGWDWVGLNLDDGSSLMAFRMRDRDGGQLWAGGTLRRVDGGVETFGPREIEFSPGRRWRSLRTSIEYPVSWRVRAGVVRVELQPLFDDQEADSRATTGAVYWEGAVQALRAGERVGRGYLELTGYGEPLRLPGDEPGR